MPKKTKDGRWRVDLRPAGRSGPRRRKLFTHKDEALRFEAHLRAQASAGKPWNPSQVDKRSLETLIATWFARYGRTLRSGEDRHRMLQAIDVALGKPRAVEVTAKKYTDYRAKRLEAGITPNTCNHELAYLRALFAQLKACGEWSEANPLADVDAIPLVEKEMAWLDHPQIVELLRQCARSSNPCLLPAVCIALDTGARWGEIMALQKRHFRDGKVFFTSTKNGKVRALPYRFPAIDAYVKKNSDPLFFECITAFRKALKRAGIALPKGQLTHVCRHTYGASFIRKGGSIKALQLVLDHSSLQMTMRYAHFALDHMKDFSGFSPLASVKVDTLRTRRPAKKKRPARKTL